MGNAHNEIVKILEEEIARGDSREYVVGLLLGKGYTYRDVQDVLSELYRAGKLPPRFLENDSLTRVGADPQAALYTGAGLAQEDGGSRSFFTRAKLIVLALLLVVLGGGGAVGYFLYKNSPRVVVVEALARTASSSSFVYQARADLVYGKGRMPVRVDAKGIYAGSASGVRTSLSVAASSTSSLASFDVMLLGDSNAYTHWQENAPAHLADVWVAIPQSETSRLDQFGPLAVVMRRAKFIADFSPQSVAAFKGHLDPLFVLRAQALPAQSSVQLYAGSGYRVDLNPDVKRALVGSFIGFDDPLILDDFVAAPWDIYIDGSSGYISGLHIALPEREGYVLTGTVDVGLNGFERPYKIGLSQQPISFYTAQQWIRSK